jgi:hypothetical protein
MAKDNKRFVVYKEAMGLSEITILMDRKTGVNYLYYSSGYGGGLTPLLDRDGKVVVTPVSDER